MAIERRKDNKKRVLKEGEYQRANGTFEYKWRDRRGKRHSVYAKTLDELRDKELDVLRDVLDGVRSEGKDITIGSEADCAITQHIVHIVLCNLDGITITFFRHKDCHT